MTKPAKSRTASEAGIEDGGDEGENVAADGVLERVQLDAGDAVAEIDERSAGVGADDAECVRRKSATRAWPGTAGIGTDWPLQAGSRHRDRASTSLSAKRRAEPCDGSADRQAASPSCGRRFRRRRPHPTFRRAEFPVEAGAHGGVDGGGVVGDFADAFGGEVPQ